MADPTPEEQARIDAMRARLGELPEGVEIDFQVIDPGEMPAKIAETDAATFLPVAGFGYYRRGEGLPILPSIELDGPEWLEQAIRENRATCAAYGIGNQIEGVDVPMFASFQFTVDGHYTPIFIWLDKAPPEWLSRALRRFVIVFPAGPDKKRAWFATGEMSRFPEGVVVPPKLGRNDPCPCGSGKKYKRCHGV